jgi:hypothetical protein
MSAQPPSLIHQVLHASGSRAERKETPYYRLFYRDVFLAAAAEV